MNRYTPTLAIVLLSSTGTAFAAQTWTLERARLQWAEATKNPVPDLLYVEWTRTFPPSMSEAEVAERRAQIADNPEHPDQILLNQVARQLASGGDQEVIRAWHYSPDQYRINIDTPYSESSPHDDYARDNNIAWSYAQSGAVTVVDVRSSPEDRNPTRLYSTLSTAATLLVRSGWGLGPPGLSPTDFGMTGDTWRMDVTSADGEWVYSHRGSVIEDSNELLTTETRLVKAPTGSGAGSRVVYAGHVFVPDLGIYIPKSVTSIGPDNREVLRLEIIKAAELSRSDMAGVLAVPAVDRTDPTRNDMPVTVVMDYRPQTQAVTYFSEDGTASETQPLNSTTVPPKSLRTIGWVLAGLFVVTLGVLRFRARGQ